ncbi:nicotinate-nucleotide pyrophosphorylase [carboxylating]-like [Stegodyphus dumicola]|uniref:nicotinate-nucleotide pyrophosphorylase [carboxylating]-like n=1 Tax=Stegodyphus dumicola TaxID=202533 RepID=UPI0015A9D83F|nr:nicotinate-nucleotide pyrophosphorylase [carboxylating]-like [Stegodyphus dumicola]
MCENILHPLRLRDLARQWLLEDTSNFNIGNSIIGDSENEFTIYMKSPGILAGIPFVNAVFNELDLTPQWLHREGEDLKPVTEVAKINGPARNLLLAERVVLNILSRSSGVATSVSKMSRALVEAGWKGILAGSRKTTPGFRMVEKYALLIGGADMHRYDLSSMIMLKDNHISIYGSIHKAIEEVRKYSSFALKIEVECNSLKDALEACKANCDVVMLDNFQPEELKKTALTLKLQFPDILIEASGGISMENVTDYVNPWIDIISSSSLVQGYKTVDFSMKVKKGRS